MHTMSLGRFSTAPLAGQQVHGDLPFPLVWQGTSDITLTETRQWLSAHGAELGQLAYRHGALLFRGFPVHTAADFDAVVAAIAWPNIP